METNIEEKYFGINEGDHLFMACTWWVVGG